MSDQSYSGAWSAPSQPVSLRSVKLTFLGTRGYTGSCSPEHRQHSALLVGYRGARIMIDCGEDWLGRLGPISPQAVFITHGHPDHAFGLKDGSNRPVYATEECWNRISDFPIADCRTVIPREPITVGAFRVEAFPVIHSIRAPAVGYRVGAGRVVIFYVPDVIDIVDRHDALSNIRVYIGDGASLTRSLVRRKGAQIFGHTTVRAQLGWCREEGVKRAIFTHCGSEIINGDQSALREAVKGLGLERGVHAEIAHDGLELVLK